MCAIASHVSNARQRLKRSLRQFQKRHDAACGGRDLCAAVTALRDEVLTDLFEAALAEAGENERAALEGRVALVALGADGRREIAPYSDVDLMLLHAPSVAATVAPLARRWMRDVFDAGLTLGHSVRTPRAACRLACRDPVICTSLIDARRLIGSADLFERFTYRFHQAARRRSRLLIAEVEKARLQERAKYGQTVFLLEPNVKRSPGGLRDVQLLRWIAELRHGTTDLGELGRRGALAEEDCRVIEAAGEFLLRLRNEMHFHAGRASDLLDRAEQLRIAAAWGYPAATGMLPVERFMRDYFRHTGQTAGIVDRFVAQARAPGRVKRFFGSALGHRVERDLRVSAAGVEATRRGRRRIAGNLASILQVVDLANLLDRPVAPDTWAAIRRHAPQVSEEITPEAIGHFRSLLACPSRPGEMLRGLRDVGLLERMIPDFAHARGLLQFNQYHKYTVDEHCLRAVECAAALQADPTPLGEVYRQIRRKDLLHLALLIHDLGKGHPEDHRIVGEDIARRTAARLQLDDEETDTLTFLVGSHMVMNQLAFRRDTSDEQLIVRFAVDVGSLERLKMLLVTSAADLTAVGPGVWTGWKAEVLADLYDRTMQCLAGESAAVTIEEQTRRIADELHLDHRLEPGDVVARAHYFPETETIQCDVGTTEEVVPGVFHRLVGALTEQRLEILSAGINTLDDGLVLDRFLVRDPDTPGGPSSARLGEIEKALLRSLRGEERTCPSFRPTRRVGVPSGPAVSTARVHVHVDNNSSAQCTILDVFTPDRPGLLHAISSALFALGLSVSRAKITTYPDQVVDVFYVTDQQGEKIVDPLRLQQTRQALWAAIAGGQG